MNLLIQYKSWLMFLNLIKVRPEIDNIIKLKYIENNVSKME